MQISEVIHNSEANSKLTVYSKFNKLNKQLNSKLTVGEIEQILSNFSDVVRDESFYGFYVNKIKEIGKDRFIELANKARKGSNDPERLFCWMLKNSQKVR